MIYTSMEVLAIHQMYFVAEIYPIEVDSLAFSFYQYRPSCSTQFLSVCFSAMATIAYVDSRINNEAC